MYEVYEPQVWQYCNGAADADQEGRPIDLTQFYVTARTDDGAELIAGPFPLEVAERVVDEIGAVAYRCSLTGQTGDPGTVLPSGLSSEAHKAINRSTEAFKSLVAEFRQAHAIITR